MPLIYSRPGIIRKDPVVNDGLANYVILGTMADLLNVLVMAHNDRLSFLPLLYGKPVEKQRDLVVCSSVPVPALLTQHGWKLCTYLLCGKQLFPLY